MDIRVVYGKAEAGMEEVHSKMVSFGVEWLKEHGANIEGSVLNIGSRDDPRKYKQYFPKSTRYRNLDIVNYENVDIIADITNMSQVPPKSEDCIVSMWTFYQIKEIEKALKEVHRVLKPNGVLLATFTGPGRKWKRVWWPSGDYTKAYNFGRERCSNILQTLFKTLVLKEYVYNDIVICTYIKATPRKG